MKEPRGNMEKSDYKYLNSCKIEIVQSYKVPQITQIITVLFPNSHIIK